MKLPENYDLSVKKTFINKNVYHLKDSCLVCNEPYLTQKQEAKFCSYQCRQKYLTEVAYKPTIPIVSNLIDRILQRDENPVEMIEFLDEKKNEIGETI